MPGRLANQRQIYCYDCSICTVASQQMRELHDAFFTLHTLMRLRRCREQTLSLADAVARRRCIATLKTVKGAIAAIGAESGR